MKRGSSLYRYVSISDPSKQWKWENGTLKNKASLLQPNVNLTIEFFNGKLIRMKNNPAKKFLQAQQDGGVLTNDLKDNELDQLWIQGKNLTIEFFNGTLIRIKNNTANKFLQAEQDGRVLTNDLNDNEVGQIWIQGKADTKGYFTLESSKGQNQMLTAVSKNNLEIKSK